MFALVIRSVCLLVVVIVMEKIVRTPIDEFTYDEEQDEISEFF